MAPRARAVRGRMVRRVGSRGSVSTANEGFGPQTRPLRPPDRSLVSPHRMGDSRRPMVP
jgi:hypothetical protein